MSFHRLHQDQRCSRGDRRLAQRGHRPAEFYLFAEQRIAETARQSELSNRAAENTRAMLTTLFGQLGYRVTFDGGTTMRRVLVVLAGTWLLAACVQSQDDLVPMPPPSSDAPPASQTTSPSNAATPTASGLPDVVGMRLSDAQRLLSEQGYSRIEPTDASGEGRPVLEPLNWIVQVQDPPAGTPAGPGTVITLRVVKPTDGADDTETVVGVVPHVVCKDLQSAQDTMQSAGFYNLSSTDETGQNRQQVVDRNWVVVSQSVAAGERPDRGTRIVLGAVKSGEPTGASGCAS